MSSSPSLGPEARALEALGDRVRELRHAANLTLAELAERTGLSARYLVSLEGGDGNISLLRLFELADALRVSAAELVAAAEKARQCDPTERSTTIALVGLRGAGKTSVGRALAKTLGTPFVELDGLIAERAGMTLSMIFEMHGEAYFRRLERETLEHVLGLAKPLVLATGGSLVTADETYALLRRRTHTVWLKARAEEHWDRVVAQGDGRPMKGRANAMNELRALLKTRAPLYGLADVTVETGEAEVERIAAILAGRFAPPDSTQARPKASTRRPTQRTTRTPKHAR
jgi:XRE family transcriptional regulator, aerobic/anaerobic benzoate catabolism transcriptional regulator